MLTTLGAEKIIKVLQTNHNSITHYCKKSIINIVNIAVE